MIAGKNKQKEDKKNYYEPLTANKSENSKHKEQNRGKY